MCQVQTFYVRLRTAQYISDNLFDCLSHWITVGNLELIRAVHWLVFGRVKAFIRLNHLLCSHSKGNLDNFADRMAYFCPINLLQRVTGNQGSIPEREPEKRLPHPRKATGAQITQSRQ
ncbi:hypothetical protein RF11_15293 [Thelohanellus kitauei]|uniref:Uncharacterized protein n=1 Tax=Thelohanellus kitauei TaxID=669202 RepID=A0A0C2IV19_THEKT|nr:hypothetical protein RF11_15293 [Thelohanellus kitauei]